MKTKSLLRLSLLLTVKESYLLARNVWGLVAHPYKTLAVINREKDRSQQLLVYGLPAVIFVVGLAGVYVGRRLLATTVEWGGWAKASMAMVVLVTMLSGWYLAVWILRIAKWRENE